MVFSSILSPVCYPGSQAHKRHSKDSRRLVVYPSFVWLLAPIFSLPSRSTLSATRTPTRLRARSTHLLATGPDLVLVQRGKVLLHRRIGARKVVH